MLQVPTPGASLLMTEPLLNLPSIQRTTLEVVFEQFNFQSFFSAPGPEFSMRKWAADNPHDAMAQSLSGVVLDAGYSFTHAVPIFDGRVRRSAVRRLRLGGKLLTNLMKEWVRNGCLLVILSAWFIANPPCFEKCAPMRDVMSYAFFLLQLRHPVQQFRQLCRVRLLKQMQCHAGVVPQHQSQR